MTLVEAPAAGALNECYRGRAALRYYGAKWSVADWIVSHFPPHHGYVEPYGGSAAVLLRKPPAPRETYNDLDSAVVAFWRCLRDQPDALIRAVELTPFAREEMDGADIDATGLTDLERARRLYIRSWQTIHGAPSRGRMGWRSDVRHTGNGTNVEAWCRTAHLWMIAARLRRVQIEHLDALECIRRYDTPQTLHYVDPPYVAGTRGDRWATVAYAVEMCDQEHRQLAALLHECQGLVVLSGYHSPLYRELYRDWPLVTHAARKQSRGDAKECLWLSPRAAAAQRQASLPLDLDAPPLPSLEEAADG